MVEKFLIANYETGLETDKEPWILPNDAFPILRNMYVWRGRVRRQPGFKLIGQLVEEQSAVGLGNTDGAGEFAGNLGMTDISPRSVVITVGGNLYTDDGNGNLILNPPIPLSITGISQTNPAVVSVAGHPFVPLDLVRITDVLGMVQINDSNYTVGVTAAGTFEVSVDATTFDAYSSGGLVNWVGTINYATGDITISSNLAATPVNANFNTIPCLPVMGLSTRETDNINFEQLIAFDTVHANLYNNATNQFIDISFGTVWTGGNADFFWTTNYFRDVASNRLFWATNNVAADGIRYFDGTAWTTQLATINAAGNTLVTSLILLPYKDRLVALNTLETPGGGANERFFQRARWSQNGTPVTAVDVDAWRDDIVGKGGFIDCPTSEAIISAEFIRDTLIVFFERSTYRLAYTGNELLPFIWEQINTELGGESTFSVVPFDNGVFAVGDRGIVTANSNNVARIDNLIPDTVFEIRNDNEGPQRVHGQRDYRRELTYWTYPGFMRDDHNQNVIFPNLLLVLNYKEGSYSFFTGSFTTLGTMQLNNDRIWSISKFPWNSANFTWSDPINQARFPLIIGGNQQGFVHFFDEDITNDPCLKIDNISQAIFAVVTSTNHNLDIGAVIEFSEVQGMTEINGQRAVISDVLTPDTFEVDLDTTTFTPYAQGGKITCLNNFLVRTKRFNPFISTDKSVDIPYIDFYLDNTNAGEFTLSVFVDENNSQSMPNLFTGDPNFIVSTSASNTFVGNTAQDKVWVRVHIQSTGQFIQLQMELNDEQMLDPTTQSSEVTLHGMILNAQSRGRLI